MHLNAAVENYTDTPEETSDKFLDFYFLNLEYRSEDNSFLGY